MTIWDNGKEQLSKGPGIDAVQVKSLNLSPEMIAKFGSKIQRFTGPQIGDTFPVAGLQCNLNLKGYKEFDAAHRPDGWNVRLTLAISPAAAIPATPAVGMTTK
jgi:hypothetical protein